MNISLRSMVVVKVRILEVVLEVAESMCFLTVSIIRLHCLFSATLNNCISQAKLHCNVEFMSDTPPGIYQV